jgi:hypothetical protein
MTRGAADLVSNTICYRLSKVSLKRSLMSGVEGGQVVQRAKHSLLYEILCVGQIARVAWKASSRPAAKLRQTPLEEELDGARLAGFRMGQQGDRALHFSGRLLAPPAGTEFLVGEHVRYRGSIVMIPLAVSHGPRFFRLVGGSTGYSLPSRQSASFQKRGFPLAPDDVHPA